MSIALAAVVVVDIPCQKKGSRNDFTFPLAAICSVSSLPAPDRCRFVDPFLRSCTAGKQQHTFAWSFGRSPSGRIGRKSDR
jgi:hypothetical protein